MQVPLRTRVKLPHSLQASPSYPLARASARFSAAWARASAWVQGRCSIGTVAGRVSGSALSAAAKPPRAVVWPPANEVTLPPPLPRPSVGVPRASALPPLITTSLSVRERVSPFDTYFDADADGAGLPSSTPLP